MIRKTTEGLMKWNSRVLTVRVRVYRIFWRRSFLSCFLVGTHSIPSVPFADESMLRVARRRHARFRARQRKPRHMTRHLRGDRQTILDYFDLSPPSVRFSSIQKKAQQIHRIYWFKKRRRKLRRLPNILLSISFGSAHHQREVYLCVL